VSLKTRTDEAVATLCSLQAHLQRPNAQVKGVTADDLDWPLRVFRLLQQMSEGDVLAEAELRRELEPWNRGG
jgi:hypothetical protein